MKRRGVPRATDNGAGFELQSVPLTKGHLHGMRNFSGGDVIKRRPKPGDLGIKDQGDTEAAMAGTKGMQERPISLLREVEYKAVSRRPLLNKLDQTSDANETGFRPILLAKEPWPWCRRLRRAHRRRVIEDHAPGRRSRIGRGSWWH